MPVIGLVRPLTVRLCSHRNTVLPSEYPRPKIALLRDVHWPCLLYVAPQTLDGS